MPVVLHNPQGVFPPYVCYSHAAEVRGDARLLFISGLNGYLADGRTMPDTFEEQGDLVWQHLGTILRAAGQEIPGRAPSVTDRRLLPASRTEMAARGRSRGGEIAAPVEPGPPDPSLEAVEPWRTV
jgi:enamine deaminase RidA (YjgF/YER057c/UK114 family)